MVIILARARQRPGHKKDTDPGAGRELRPWSLAQLITHSSTVWGHELMAKPAKGVAAAFFSLPPSSSFLMRFACDLFVVNYTPHANW